VIGFVQSGLYDYDSSLAYADISATQKLFGLETTVSGIGIRIKDPDDSERIARDLQVRFQGAYWVRSWLSLNKNLFSALKLEKTVMFIILILVTLVASVMIVSNLLLNITQKTKEIGILRAMGANAKTIREFTQRHKPLFEGRRAFHGLDGPVAQLRLGIAAGIGGLGRGGGRPATRRP
jgi:lipoprotein-releasing system permease protein